MELVVDGGCAVGVWWWCWTEEKVSILGFMRKVVNGNFGKCVIVCVCR